MTVKYEFEETTNRNEFNRNGERYHHTRTKTTRDDNIDELELDDTPSFATLSF